MPIAFNKIEGIHKVNNSTQSEAEKELQQIGSNVSQLQKELFSAANTPSDEMLESAIKCRNISEGISLRLAQIPILLGCSKKELDQITPVDKTNDIIKIEKNGSCITIILSSLLPYRRNDRKVSNNDLSFTRSAYYKAFADFSEKSPTTYKEKVVILITNYFLSKNDMKDDDNLDSKVITDMINQFFLIDDNPIRCMKVFDYGISNYRHSEIKIFPVSEWHNYIELPYL